MRTKVRMSLNNEWLDEIDSRIVLQSVNESAPAMAQNAINKIGGIGQIATSKSRTTLDVSVSFTIKDVNNYEGRAELLNRLNAWFNKGGILRVNYRPKERLNVICTQLPAVGYVRNWTNEYTVNLRAMVTPYWEQDELDTVTVTTANNARSFMVDGTVETPVFFTMENKSTGTINNATVILNDQRMVFNGLNLKSGMALVVDYNDNGIMRIRIRNGSTYTDAMAKRTAASVDELMARPGENALQIISDRICLWNVYARGRSV